MSGQQPQHPSGQPYQLPYQQGEPRRTNTTAVLALVFAFVVAPLGVVFGFVARSQIKRTGEAGAGLALAGIIVGLAVVVLSLVAIVGVFAVVAGPVGPSG